jgi:hypothetical protein
MHVRGSGSYEHDYKKPVRVKKPTAIAHRSERGQDEFDDWQERKIDHLVEFPDCQVAGFLPGKCSPGDPDVHHITPRSMGGTHNDEDTELLTACRAHHDFIERHRDYARVHGLLKRRELPEELRSTAEIPNYDEYRPASPVASRETK